MWSSSVKRTVSKLLACAFVPALTTGCAVVDVKDVINNWGDVPTRITFRCTPSNTESAGSGIVRDRFLGVLPPDGGMPAPLVDSEPAQSASALFRSSRAFVSGGLAISGTEAATARKPEFALERSDTIQNELGKFEDWGAGAFKNFGEGLQKSIPTRPFTAGAVYGAGGGGVEASGVAAQWGENNEIFVAYLMEWATKGYVSRNGAKLARPEVSLNFGASTFGALTQLYIEAQRDGITRTPILTKKSGNETVYLPKETKERPTAVTLEVVDVLALSEDPKVCGITEAEYKVMRLAATSAADGSAMLSSILLEFLGDVELSLVVGANFSIGDAETVPTIARTFVSSTVDGLQDAILFNFFYTMSYETVASRVSGTEAAGAAASIGGIQPLNFSVNGVEGSSASIPPALANVLHLVSIAERNVSNSKRN